MAVLNRLRHRLSLTQLSAHHVEESYTEVRRLRDTDRENTTTEEPDAELPDLDTFGPLELPPLFLPVQQNLYDPGERIPSYELSQEQHQHQMRSRLTGRTAPNIHSESGPPILTTTNFRGRYAENRPLRVREWVDRQAASPARSGRKTLKNLGLKFLNARQHILLAACRDISLIPCLLGLFQSWWVLVRAVPDTDYSGANSEAISQAISQANSVVTAARHSEHFLTGIWCIVAGYLLYSVLDGLMVRWIVTYSTTGAIVRMMSMSTILIAIEEYLVAAFLAEGYAYALHTWILISCALTVLYIVQNFVTSNIDLKGNRRARFFDFYNIVVFAVVPVGLASFITMVGVLRSLLILRLDIDARSGVV